jgi:hypothetical protein
VLRAGACGRFARLHRAWASQSAHLQFRLHFAWERPDTRSRTFTASFAQHAPSIGSGIQLGFDAETVTGEPNDAALIRFARHSAMKCGSVHQIAEVAAWGLTAEILVVAKQDTTRSHGRWSLRQDMTNDLPDAYRFVLTGRTAGDL